MDAFEKWTKDAENYTMIWQESRMNVSEKSFRAGMRAAAEIAMRPDHDGLTVQDAILKEADK